MVGYNFVLQNDRVYALFGFSEESRDNSVICSSILRQWNLNRLKIDQIGRKIEVEHLHRTVEHMYSICRGFMREVSDDYNTLKINLRNFMNLI